MVNSSHISAPRVTHGGTLSPQSPDPPAFPLCVVAPAPAARLIHPCPQATPATAPQGYTTVPFLSHTSPALMPSHPCRLVTAHPVTTALSVTAEAMLTASGQDSSWPLPRPACLAIAVTKIKGSPAARGLLVLPPRPDPPARTPAQGAFLPDLILVLLEPIFSGKQSLRDHGLGAMGSNPSAALASSCCQASGALACSWQDHALRRQAVPGEAPMQSTQAAQAHPRPTSHRLTAQAPPCPPTLLGHPHASQLIA